jgi:hypothetical protein
MAAVEFQIIYLDRRAREEGVYTRQNRPKKTASRSQIRSGSLYNILGSADEVDDNVNQLLEQFERGEKQKGRATQWHNTANNIQ